MSGFLMFVGAVAFASIIGVGMFWFIMNTKFGEIKSLDDDDNSNNENKE